MKFQLFLPALLCLSISLHSQVQFGAKAIVGTSLTQRQSKEFIDIQGNNLYELSYDASTSRKGIGLSIFAQNDLLFFNTDAMYTTSGHNFSLVASGFSRTRLDPGVDLSMRQQNITLAISSGVKLGKIKLGVGPELSLTTSTTERLSEMESFSLEQPRYNTGFNFTTGYMLNKHLHIDLRYTYIFQDVSNNYHFQGMPLDLRKNAKYLELGISTYL